MLIDELDLHLHPVWQVGLITTRQQHVTPYLITSQPFVALSLDIYDHHFDAALRQRWNLPLDPSDLEDL